MKDDTKNLCKTCAKGMGVYGLAGIVGASIGSAVARTVDATIYQDMPYTIGVIAGAGIVGAAVGLFKMLYDEDEKFCSAELKKAYVELERTYAEIEEEHVKLKKCRDDLENLKINK